MAIEGKKPSQLDDATVEALRDRLNLVPGQGSMTGGYVAGNASTAQKPGISANQTLVLPDDTALDFIYLEDTAGTPTVKIGTTLGGSELVPEQLIAGYTPISLVGVKFAISTMLYISVSGGTVNFRLDYRSSFWTSVVGPFDPSASYTKQQIDTALGFKADKTNVLLLDGATPDKQPASKADINGALVLMWLGDISKTGAINTLAGTTNIISCIPAGDGVFNITHDINDIKYVVLPCLGLAPEGFYSPRNIFNKTTNSFSVRVSDDGSGNTEGFQIMIYKYV